MDPYIAFPNNQKVRLSQIEATRQSRLQFLERYRGNGGELRCLCHEEGVPLGVGHRTVPQETYYFYPLHRLDPSSHARGCPHRINPNATPAKIESVPVIEEHDGKLNINLASPLYRGAASDEDPSQNDTVTNDGVRHVMHGRLLTMLELLWSESQLNVWRPYFEGKRFYGMVSHRLQKQAERMEIKGMSLSNYFYIAPAFHPGDEAKAENRVRSFLKHLEPDNNGRRYYGYVVGLLKKATTTDGAVILGLAHTKLRVWCHQERWDSISRRWLDGCVPENVNATDDPCMVLARVLRHTGKNGPWLSLEDIAFLHVSDTNSWIPVDSIYERRLALMLVAEHRHFRKPMQVELDGEDNLLPDFVLEDRPDYTNLEVLGMLTDPAYRQHWVLKLARYQSAGQALWLWDPQTQNVIPTLPPAQQRDKNEREPHQTVGQGA